MAKQAFHETRRLRLIPLLFLASRFSFVILIWGYTSTEFDVVTPLVAKQSSRKTIRACSHRARKDLPQVLAGTFIESPGFVVHDVLRIARGLGRTGQQNILSTHLKVSAIATLAVVCRVWLLCFLDMVEGNLVSPGAHQRPL